MPTVQNVEFRYISQAVKTTAELMRVLYTKSGQLFQHQIIPTIRCYSIDITNIIKVALLNNLRINQSSA